MKLKLIDEARHWYKFWSVKLGALGTAITSILVLFPDAAIHAWSILPHEMKSKIPPEYMPMIGVLVFVLAIFAVFVKQRNIK